MDGSFGTPKGKHLREVPAFGLLEAERKSTICERGPIWAPLQRRRCGEPRHCSRPADQPHQSSQVRGFLHGHLGCICNHLLLGYCFVLGPGLQSQPVSARLNPAFKEGHLGTRSDSQMESKQIGSNRPGRHGGFFPLDTCKACWEK